MPKLVCVPKVPTQKMLDAGCRALSTNEAREAILIAGTQSNAAIAEIKLKIRWAAMLAAAQ